jgi:DNA-binding CsgD family transcriptional regulator
VRARGYGALAQVLMIIDRSAEAVRYADLAIADADEIGDAYVSTQARIERGSALNMMVNQHTARQALLDGIERARAIGDGVLVSRGINNLLDLLPPHSAEARSHLDELYRVAARSGFDKLGRDALRWEMDVAFGVGDLGAYRRAVEQGYARWSNQTHPKMFNQATMVQVVLAIEEGRVADARRVLDNSPEASKIAGCDGVTIRTRWHGIAVLASLTDDVASARAALAGYMAGGPLRDGAWVVGDLVSLVDALLQAGLPTDEVRALHERFASHPSMEAIREYSEGLLLAADGHHRPAADRLLAALDDDPTVLASPFRASVRLVLASALLADGDRAGALDQARAAHDVDLARWPGWRRDRAEAMLRRLEGSTQRNDGGLTAREREVAALIAQGLTNGQLADRLYISPKTAAVHVSNILTKLGVSGRAEVAAWAVRNGLEIAA